MKIILLNCSESVRGIEMSGFITRLTLMKLGTGVIFQVKKFWAEKGISGFTVFKFSLHRMEGQPMLTTEQVSTLCSNH